VIKHILTSDAIIIPSDDGILQFTKSNPNFSKIVDVCLKKSSTLKDLTIVKSALNYEDDEISLTFNQRTEEYELFHNSKYHYIDGLFTNMLHELINNHKSNFKIEYVIKMFMKMLNNPYVKFDVLFAQLLQKGFLFVDSGNIIVEKNWESESNRYYDRKRSIECNQVKRTLIEIDPQNLEADFSIFGYTVIESHLTTKNEPILTPSYVSNIYHFLRVYNQLLKYDNIAFDKKSEYAATIAEDFGLNIADVNVLLGKTDMKKGELALELTRV
jgi:hypothetical protein